VVVVDANIVLTAAAAEDGFDVFGQLDLAADLPHTD